MYPPATDNALAFQIKTTDKTILENKKREPKLSTFIDQQSRLLSSWLFITFDLVLNFQNCKV